MEYNVSNLDLKSLREIQEKVARLLSDSDDSLLPEQNREPVQLLAELLMHTDQVIGIKKFDDEEKFELPYLLTTPLLKLSSVL